LLGHSDYRDKDLTVDLSSLKTSDLGILIPEKTYIELFLVDGRNTHNTNSGFPMKKQFFLAQKIFQRFP